MFQDTQPAPLPADGEHADWQDFRVTHPAEVLALLRQLRDEDVPLHLSAPTGRHLTTTLWAVDDATWRLNFSVGTSDAQAQDLLASDEITAVAYLDAVKLQFDLPSPMLVRSAQSVSLQSGWPAALYRLQRRDAYRVRTLDRSSPTALLRHPALPDMTLALRVIDVSIGGCALFVDHDVPPLQPGTQVNAVRIELDSDTRFEAGLSLQHVSNIYPGQRGLRIGCEWSLLSSGAERVLQRYIDQTQKRRRLLVLD